MKVKGLILMVAVLTAFVCMPAVAMADTFTFTGGAGYGVYQTGSGGEFTVRPGDRLNWILNNYDAKAKIGNALQTFCLETNEYVWPNSTYSVVLSNATVYGGAGGAVDGRDPLSKGAAWLYNQFARGILQDYNYTDPTLRQASADALQKTIWWPEGEQVNPNNVFTQKVISMFEEVGAKADNNGAYPVMVANLWEPGHLGESGYQRQDQLIASAAPIPPTVWLLGAGLFGVGFIRKRIKKS